MSDAPKVRDLVHVSREQLESALELAQREGAAPPTLSGFVVSLAAEQLNDALDVDPYDLLAGVWAKAKAVKEAAAKSRATPGKPTVVTLGRHELKHTCNPVLAVFMGEVPLPEIRLTLELVARLDSAELCLKDGRLTAISPGNGSVAARLKYRSTTLAEETTPTVKIPGSIALQPALEV
ncbi:MAG TPA: hypothetical protein VFP36_15480 [Usitatibacter sp.]|nr:hypothetical protein [Usitatibacter sp.]